MKHVQIELNSREQLFKSFYKDGGQAIMERPMMLSEYRALSDRHRIMDDIIEKYHVENRAAENINTIRDIREPGSEDLIQANEHGRYSYPLMHNHGYVEIIYVYQGTCTHFVENNRFEMKAGDFCILAPNTVHAISAVHDDDLILNVIISQPFFGSTFLHLLRKEPVIIEFFENILYKRAVSPYILYPTGDDPTMQTGFQLLHRESSRKDYLHNESMSLLVRQIFIHLLRHYEMNAIVANPLNHSQENNIVALISYISVNYDHITLNSTAEFFGYNVTYLSRLLKKCTGKSFSEMINDAQMNNAKKLLLETNVPITEIAYKVGCYDASHFTRKFKTSVGMTPAQFRKTAKAESLQA